MLCKNDDVNAGEEIERINVLSEMENDMAVLDVLLIVVAVVFLFTKSLFASHYWRHATTGNGGGKRTVIEEAKGEKVRI